jgi:light-independent protochlorophyllide reductase subunit B
MQLAVWTYEGPPHVGAMRVATAMEGVHYVLHAPQGDTYADLLFTMIERRNQRPPVTYTTFQARDLGKDTAALLQDAIREAAERFAPQALLVGASCTAELIQDDPAGLAEALSLPCPVIPLELPSYQRKENWGAAETFYRMVRHLADPAVRPAPRDGRRPLANLLGPCALGFRHRDDVVEVVKLLESMGVGVNCVAPLGATPADLRALGRADFNLVLYPEIGAEAARWLGRTFGQPAIDVVPIGVGATRDFIAAVAAVAGVDPAPALATPPRACRGGAARSIRPISPASASSSSAMPPMPLPPRASRPKSWVSPSAAWAATTANSPARCAPPPRATGSIR